MLDAYIIEELKRRERERQREDRQRPTLEIPRPEDDARPRRSEPDEHPGTGGTVVTIDL